MARTTAIVVILAFAIVTALMLLGADQGWAKECGMASWYGSESGSRTASGEHFDPDGITAAHRSLPFGTRIVVTDMHTGRSVRVRVTDRGPARWTGRIIDLSRGAARRLGMIKRGTARVCLQEF